MPTDADRPIQQPGATGRLQIPRWLGLVAGLAGTLLGIAASLYSVEFRTAITTAGRRFTSPAISIVVATIVASATTTLVFRWLVRRSQRRARIIAGEIIIGSDALNSVKDDQDLVVGRSLHYIEAKRDSTELVIFLHGLGLDANDFRPYIAESRFHCIALTLYGFNSDEKDDRHYRPISLQTHVQLLGYALQNIRQLYPTKRLALVGFSFGADMLLFLPQFAAEASRSIKASRAVLLDPNVNQTTTTISSRIAIVEKDRPLKELVAILESAGNVTDFRNLCEYLYKITAKNFAQIQRHAIEVIGLWPGEAYDNFLDRLGQTTNIVDDIRLVLSFDYERHFNAIARGATNRGLDQKNLECSQWGHFDLISSHFLKDLLEGVL
jgi:pimeloyl-ACP methyl ester carboxylesterase